VATESTADSPQLAYVRLAAACAAHDLILAHDQRFRVMSIISSRIKRNDSGRGLRAFTSAGTLLLKLTVRSGRHRA